jgi:hypothetical protein
MKSSLQRLAELHAALGYKQLNPLWAKLEIFLGVLAAGIGLLVGEWAFSHRDTPVDWNVVAGGLMLFVLGAYLAMAGHRSHLYQSLNNHTALLLDEIRKSTSKGHSS